MAALEVFVAEKIGFPVEEFGVKWVSVMSMRSILKSCWNLLTVSRFPDKPFALKRLTNIEKVRGELVLVVLSWTHLNRRCPLELAAGQVQLLLRVRVRPRVEGSALIPGRERELRFGYLPSSLGERRREDEWFGLPYKDLSIC